MPLTIPAAVFIAPMGSPIAYQRVFADALSISDAVLERFKAHVEQRLQFQWRDLEVADVSRLVDTPPLFIVHAKDDKGVIVENSTKLAEAAKQANVPHELVLFETGGHGFGLGAPGSECSVWPEKLIAWMRSQKLLVEP